MIYITGDCHGDFRRFNKENFPEQKEMTRDDYVIICGDFGGVWNYKGETKEERYWLDWLEDHSYTTLFVDGNHENFDRLYAFAETEWNGGCVHEIRPHVLHLMRGFIFDIDGVSIFAFGGARSHDIRDGLLDPSDANFKETYNKLVKNPFALFRVIGMSWWPEEMPIQREMRRGIDNLEKRDKTVDFIVTHEGPLSDLTFLYKSDVEVNELNKYLEDVRRNTEYKKWFFGHHHLDHALNSNDILIYEQIVRIH